MVCGSNLVLELSPTKQNAILTDEQETFAFTNFSVKELRITFYSFGFT
jgi:hypothetical protein